MDGQDDIYQGGDGTALRFFYEPVKNNFQTEKHGRPLFDTSLFVEVLTPGSTESMPKFEVERVYCAEANANPDGSPKTDGDGNEVRLTERSPKYAQYQQQIEAYKGKTGDFLTSGTPITQWAQIDVGTAASLKAMGISTVEQLAGVNDGHLGNLGTGGRVLRDQAQAFIQTRTFGVPSAKMAAETANMRDENARLLAANADLTTRLNAALTEVQALRTGQPPATPAPGGPGTDPLSMTTIAQPDVLASLDSSHASPLTPTEGEAGDAAKVAAQNTQQGLTTQQPAPPVI